MNATRYVGMGTLALNRLSKSPLGFLWHDSKGIFDSALKWASWATVMRKTALNVGSSKHGKAERAFVASNWVVARYLETQIAQMKKRCLDCLILLIFLAEQATTPGNKLRQNCQFRIEWSLEYKTRLLWFSICPVIGWLATYSTNVLSKLPVLYHSLHSL